MNWLDWLVLAGSTLAIIGYGMWRTRGRRDLEAYLHGSRSTSWLVIGLSVMATQASAITFLSTPGQGYQSGLGFVQNYFGAPFALIIISALFLPYYRRLHVHTAYELLGERFDSKTRLLGAGLFLLQRGLGAGITIYAPAIVLSTVLGWRLDLTIVCTGLAAILYTVTGGSEAVNVTQKYQLAVIFAGMATAFVVLIAKLPADVSFDDALTVAGGMQRLNAVSFTTGVNERYTFWSGVLGGMFLALSYFGTDQSQVQRYMSGSSIRESRLGLMFNAVCKIPMQFLILLLGVMVFVFYQFESPPILFNRAEWAAQLDGPSAGELRTLEAQFAEATAKKRVRVRQWLEALDGGAPDDAATTRAAAIAAEDEVEAIRMRAHERIADNGTGASANDADYVFIAFVTEHLPHGVIGLLIAAFCAATLASKSAELNALGSTTTMDFYRHVIRRDASDAHYVLASKAFTALWGAVALSFALFANMAENLIQAVNILGSVFYGVVLGLFLAAFLVPWIRGTAVFWGALTAQMLVFALYWRLSISYLWYNVIGCVACLALSAALQAIIDVGKQRRHEGLYSP